MIEDSFLQDLIKHSEKIMDLSFSKVSAIFHEVKKVLKKCPLVLEIHVSDSNDEIYVIGDIHGDLESLLHLNRIIRQKNPRYIIFLGDLVDRGPNQLECLICVFCLKLLEPERYHVLRGNHETLGMNEIYGFKFQFIQKFHESKKFFEILSVYDEIPICAIINETILCLHGGIPLDKHALKKIKGLKFKDINNQLKQSIYQIMWNDPKEEIKGFSESFRGPDIYIFGRDVFDEFMDENGLACMIRAHEWFPEGYNWFFNKRLLSIFSSENYRGKGLHNSATFAIIKNNKVNPCFLESEI